MDGTWELDGISAETSQDVRHRRERHAPRTGDEETGGLELSVGDAAGSNSGRPAVAHAAQRHLTADRRDEDPVIEVLEAVEPRAPARLEGLEELSRPRVVDPKGARNAQASQCPDSAAARTSSTGKSRSSAPPLVSSRTP